MNKVASVHRDSARAGAARTKARLRQGLLLASTALSAFCLAQSALAQTAWDGSESNNWFDSNNWTNGVPAGGVGTTIDTVTPNPTVVDQPGATAGNFGVGNALYIGRFSTGDLTVENGGTVSNSYSSWIGQEVGSNGIVTVTGTGSTWTNGGNLFVGNSGTGELTIEDGGAVSNTFGWIGYNAGSNGTVTVSGTNSMWTNVNSLSLGSIGGTGNLTVEAGGAMSSAGGQIGGSGSGTVTVTGTDSTWTNSGNLDVAANGTGELTIEAGGSVSNTGAGRIGTGFGSSGTASVTGPGSTWTIGDVLWVGGNGTGALSVQAGGRVIAPTTTVAVAAGAGTLRLEGDAGGSGLLETGQVSKGNGTGSVAFDGGTLRLSGHQSSLFSGFVAGAVEFEAGGALIDTQTFNAATGVALGGTGGLTKLGAGTLTLTGANSFTGGTTLSAGTLSIGDGGTSGTIAGDIANNAALRFNRSNALTFADDISGTGTLEKLGGGTLTLTGASSFTGGTTLSAGTLSIGDGGTSGSIAGDVVNDAVLAFNRSDAVAFGGGISGSGSLQKLGTGSTTLTGTNTYTGGTTVNGGTLQIGDGGTSGSIVGDIANNAALIFNRTNALTFADDISGTGTLQKAGAGTLTLSGLNTYTGLTTVNAGILAVAAGGSIATSAATVNAGGLVVNGTAGAVSVLGGFLGGAGTVGATTISNGATLAPGNSIGTITVNGNLTFDAGSTYAVEVSPTDADRTNVTGMANLSGATVVASYEPGSYVAKQYVIVNATGGASGEFDGLSGTAPSGFKHSLSYDASNAYLNLALLMSTGVGQFSNLSQNQKGVSDALSSYFDRTGGIPGAFAALTKDGLTSNSGEEGAAAQGAGMAFGSTFIDTIGAPDLGSAHAGVGDDGSDSAFAAARPSPAAQRFARLPYAADELSGGTNATTRAIRLQHRLETGYGEGARKPERFSVWGAALGGGISLGGNPVIGSQAVSGSTVGLASGFDWANGATRIGLALGASWSSTSVAGQGTATLGNASAGLRASHDFGRLLLSGALAYGVHFGASTRAFAGETYTASFTGQSFSARAEAGWRFRTNAIDIVPFAAGRIVSFSTPAYAESGSGVGTFALAYGAATSFETRSELGVRLHKAIRRADGSRTAFSGTLGWAHYFSRGRTVTAGFANLPGTQFATQGASGAADTALVSIGVSHRFANGVALALDLDGEFGAGTVGYAGKAKVGWNW